jgi:hypothetical protein
MTEHMTSSEAEAALSVAQSTTARMRRPARWMATYIAVFGTGFAVMTLLIGLTDLNRKRPGVLPLLWSALVLGMLIWARRQRAVRAGIGRRVGLYFAGSGVLYAAALVLGIYRFRGEPVYWIVAALVVAAPMIAGAWRELRA